MAGDILEMGMNCMELIKELGRNVKALKQEFSVIDKKRNSQLEQLTNELYNAVQIIKSNEVMITNQQTELQRLQNQLNGKDIIIKELHSQCNDLTTDLMRLQLENSNSVIRIRNFPEHENGEIAEFETWLLKEIDMEKETREKIESIQRRNSDYSKKNNLPRDIIIKCRNKVDRDGILHKLDQKIRTFNGKSVKVIRELPFKIRSRRKLYKDFTTILRQNDVRYRWILPEGLNFSFKSQSYNINSTEGIQKFLAEHDRELKELNSEMKGYSQRKYNQKNKGEAKDLKQEERKEEKLVTTKNWRAERSKAERRNEFPNPPKESVVLVEEQNEHNKLESKKKKILKYRKKKIRMKKEERKK